MHQFNGQNNNSHFLVDVVFISSSSRYCLDNILLMHRISQVCELKLERVESLAQQFQRLHCGERSFKKEAKQMF